jgi:class 3 adenylate cyclase/predicted ATPase
VDIAAWLRELGLEHYEPVFREHEIDGEVVPELTEGDLEKLGLPLGPRKKLLKAIAALGAGRGEAGDAVARAVPQEAERRQLTVMFVDLVGSTELSARLDPEDVGDVIRVYQNTVAGEIARLEGHIANFMGDGVLAYFGWPQAHEDDAERAIRASLATVEAVRHLSAPDGTALACRIGIATGLVVVGDRIGEGGAREQTVVGDSPNLAARLQAMAEPHRVVIAQSTRRLLGNLFEFVDLGPQHLKGFAEPVRTFAVAGESRVAGRFEAFHARTLTPLVGRDHELSLLLERWAAARRGDGQVVLISGEAGIGKSRLIGSLREELRDEASQAIRFFCSPYHTESALRPVIAQLERAASIDAADGAETRLAKLVSLLEAAGPQSDGTVSLFAELLSIPTAGRYPSLDLAPEERKRRTLAMLADQLRLLSASRPLLVMLEDAHWIDPTSLELFDLIVDRVPGLAVLLVVTYRPEFSPPWDGRPHVAVLTLNRLPREAVTTIVERVAGGKALPAEVIEEIRTRTDGVPLFVEELTKTVLESGLLRETDQAYVLDSPLPRLAIPTTLQDSLMARLDRLAPVREVAQIGAVIGREFSYQLLASAAGYPDAELAAALERLAGSELIFAQGSPPQATYRFKHALVRDAAYASLLRARRQQLHAVIARSLESESGDTAEHQPELLAQHYTEAGLDEQALSWWRRAGELAIRRSANIEAIRHLDKALEILGKRPQDHDRDLAELAIRIPRSGPLIAVGGYVSQELEANYARAWQLCERTGAVEQSFPVMYGQWVIPFVHGNMRLAVANGERFLKRATEQNDEALVMVGHRLLGSGQIWRGQVTEGRGHLERALAMFEPARHDALAFQYSQHPKVSALAHLCLGLQHLGELDEAMRVGFEAIAEAKRQAHFNSIAYALCFVSLMIMLRREVAPLRETARELLTISEANNAAYWKLWAEIMLGWLRTEDGAIEDGLAEIRRATSVLQDQRANVWIPQSLLLEAEIRCRLGALDDASRLLKDAEALILSPEQRYYEVEWRRLEAKLLQASGAPLEDVEAAFGRALETARAQRSKFFELRVAVDMARLSQSRPAHDARAMLRQLYEGFDQGFATADLVDARQVLGGSA